MLRSAGGHSPLGQLTTSWPVPIGAVTPATKRKYTGSGRLLTLKTPAALLAVDLAEGLLCGDSDPKVSLCRRRIALSRGTVPRIADPWRPY